MDLETITADYQYVFNGRQGQNVLADLKQMCGVDEPLVDNPPQSDRELLIRAIWHDVYKYIETMADGRGE